MPNRKHILRSLFSLAMALTSIAVSAQAELLNRVKPVRPDFDKIRTEINDRRSPYYYPRLMDEYLKNDTVMKLDKYRYLYLGYMFQEDYDPYRMPAFNVPKNLMNATTSLTREQCDSVIKYCNMALDDNPFNLERMWTLIQALKMKGQTNLAKIWQYKFNYILLAIKSTGTGEDEENAWYVIEPQHEYVLLNIMGFAVSNHVFYEPYYEYLKVINGDGSSAGGYYFNIAYILDEYYRKFPDEA